MSQAGGSPATAWRHESLAEEHVPLREWVLVSLVAVCLALAYCSELFRSWPNWGSADWDHHLVYHAVPYRSIVEYGELPLWNPYSCGGMVMHANPQARVLSPFVPLHFVFGFVTGIKLEIILHVVVGLLGAYALGREVLRSRVGAAVVAPVFMLSGMYAHSLAAGMTWFMSVAYVPWAVVGFVKSLADPGYAWLTAASLALIFFNGGAYVLPITLLALLIYAAVVSLQRRSARPVTRLATSAVMALGLGAVKLLPAIAFMREFPRPIADYSGYSLSGLFYSLFSRGAATVNLAQPDSAGFWRGVSYGPDENYMYVGPLVLVLFVVGVCVRHAQRWAWLAVLLIGVWLSFGNRAPVSAWQWLHEVPLFDSMRVAQRFRIIAMLAMALFCGLGAMAAVELVRARRGDLLGTIMATGLVLFVTADLTWTNRQVFKDAFSVPPIGRISRGAFRQVTGDEAAMLPAFLRNEGSVSCTESAGIAGHAIPSDSPDYRGEVFLHGAPGSIELLSWSPNRLLLKVAAESSGHVVINQNASDGWQVLQGNATSAVRCENKTCVPAGQGLLAIQVSPNDSVLEVYYRPSIFLIGAATTAAFLMALVMTRWPSLRRRAH